MCSKLTSSSVSIVNFEQVNADWAMIQTMNFTKFFEKLVHIFSDKHTSKIIQGYVDTITCTR